MTTTVDARFARYSSPVLSAFRIIFGLMYLLHGTIKVFGWPLGEPVPAGTWPFWWAGLIEVILGVLIVIGFFTRIAAFIASGEMAVAYFWQHWALFSGHPASFWPYDQQIGGNGGEVPVLFCFAFLLLATTGAGVLSVDARRRGGTGYAGAPPRRVGAVTAREERYVADEANSRRRGGLLDRLRRRY